ncbi:hypothetical protein EDC04DRAFT_2630001 [Pisolithus marmoratus]|nr:hypothetical protein EDC04DRAFT_2630001 [Pisolithus marmoratus]
MPAHRTIFSTSRSNGIVMRPSMEGLNRLCDDHLSVAHLYGAMQLTEAEGRALSGSVKKVIIESNFDLGKRFSEQMPRDVQRLEELVREEVPEFDQYEDQWPIGVFVRRHLLHRGELAGSSGTPTCYTFNRMSRQLDKLSQPKRADGLIHPAKSSRKLDSCSQSGMDGALVLQKTSRSCQKHYKLRDFLDAHGKTHLLFALIKAGITGDAEFESFVDMPPAVRKAFLSAALDTTPYEVDEIQIATMRCQVLVL